MKIIKDGLWLSLGLLGAGLLLLAGTFIFTSLSARWILVLAIFVGTCLLSGALDD